MRVLKNILVALLLIVMVLIVIVGSIATVLYFVNESWVRCFVSLLTTLLFDWIFLYTAVGVAYAKKNNKDFTFSMNYDEGE